MVDTNTFYCSKCKTFRINKPASIEELAIHGMRCVVCNSRLRYRDL